MSNFHLWMRKVNPSAIFMQAGGGIFLFHFFEKRWGEMNWKENKNMWTFACWVQSFRWMPINVFSATQGLFGAAVAHLTGAQVLSFFCCSLKQNVALTRFTPPSPSLVSPDTERLSSAVTKKAFGKAA